MCPADPAQAGLGADHPPVPGSNAGPGEGVPTRHVCRGAGLRGAVAGTLLGGAADTGLGAGVRQGEAHGQGRGWGGGVEKAWVCAWSGVACKCGMACKCGVGVWDVGRAVAGWQGRVVWRCGVGQVWFCILLGGARTGSPARGTACTPYTPRRRCLPACLAAGSSLAKMLSTRDCGWGHAVAGVSGGAAVL